jgi:dihydroxycyclohexadiene carboxylate dehydrogenase
VEAPVSSGSACRRFEGRVAVVTGGGQGIGRAVVRRLAAEGAAVVVGERSEQTGTDAVREVTDAGGKGIPCVVDLESYDGAERLMNAAVDGFGRIDALVNNVGGTIWMRPFDRYDPAQIEAEMARSLWPTVWCCRAVIPHMVAQGSGSIVNIGSNSPRGVYRVPYATAKGGVFALTTSLALELVDQGIRVNCVAPGGTEVSDRHVPRNPNPMTEEDRQWAAGVKSFVLNQMPMGRMGKPEEQAAAIAFLASDDASFITGQILSVAGGATVP